MENAGRSAAQLLERLHPRGRVVAAVGGGNNGGDALVLLRTLAAWGRPVGWVAAATRAPDPSLAHGFDIPSAGDDADRAFAEADLLVDGILGTGSSGAPREPAAAVIAAMNASARPILALDLPSGVDPTTGEVPGSAVQARTTVCFGWPKRGLLFPPGRAHCGRLLAVEIGFPPLDASRVDAQVITGRWAQAHLPGREFGAHKGAVGRVLIAAGRMGMGGAAALAGHSAVRAGAGLVHLVSPEANRVLLQTRVPEAIFVARERSDAVAEAAAAADALVLGPGLGIDADARGFLAQVLESSGDAPVLLDADALTLLSRDPGGLGTVARSRPTLLTPHPGEMARISGASVDEVRRDPLGAARALASETEAVVLLKGAPSVIAAQGATALIDPGGSSDLASAGLGDHLAGVAGAFLAAGADPRSAGALALWYGGRAASLAGLGRSLSPVDASEHLPYAFQEELRGPPMGLPFVVFDQPERW